MPLCAADDQDPWLRWHMLRARCDYPERLHVVLECAMEDGSPVDAASLLAKHQYGRWVAEPLQMISLPSSVWLSNAKKFPVLSKAYQTMLATFMRVPPKWADCSRSRPASITFPVWSAAPRVLTTHPELIPTRSTFTICMARSLHSR